MRFQPKTEEEIQREQLLEPGRYPFTIKLAEEKTSEKSGREYFKLKLFVHGPDNRDWHVYDNVSPHWMAHKLLHLCEATGLGAKYQQGSVTANDLVDRQGFCEVEIQPAKGGYGPKNTISDYESLEKNGHEQPQKKKETPAADTKPEDDDIPF